MNNYNYCIRRKVFAFLGAKFHVYDSGNRLIGYCHQKAFRTSAVTPMKANRWN